MTHTVRVEVYDDTIVRAEVYDETHCQGGGLR